MNQQYVLLRKENDSLNSLIGQSFNQKSKFEAYKILSEIHEKANVRSMSKVLVYCVDPKSNQILGVGGSSLMQNKKNGKIVSDLISDNFGFMWTFFHRSPISLTLSVNYIDINGNVNPRNLYRVGGNGQWDRLGGMIQVGSGTTPPARTDFKIETPFVSSPESTIAGIAGFSVYSPATGKITGIARQISPTGSSGTVNESALFQEWRNPGNRYLLARDSISPGVSFIAAQNIVVDYTWQS